MLPRKLHIEQINRFHNLLSNLDELIENETDEQKKGELCLQYYILSSFWVKIDDSIEAIKDKLDTLDLPKTITSTNWKTELNNVTQCPQRQDSLCDQLKDLRIIANKFGFYDAADFLKDHCKNISLIPKSNE